VSAANEATVRVRSGPLVAPVLGRIVGMLAARAQCPIDRLDDAMLLTDAVAAHAARYVSDEHVVVTVATDDDGLELRVGELGPGNARRMVDDGDLPGVGNVFERIADEIRPAPGAEGDELVLRLLFRP
jgi:hypothetical protein